MRLLNKPALEEVLNIAAECEFDTELRLAHAAELQALRNLHMIAAREHRGSLRFIQMISSLPRVADVAAWKKLVADSRAAADENGAADLVSTATKP